MWDRGRVSTILSVRSVHCSITYHYHLAQWQTECLMSPFVTYYCMSNIPLSPLPQAAAEAAAAGWTSTWKWSESCVKRQGPIQSTSHTSRWVHAERASAIVRQSMVLNLGCCSPAIYRTSQLYSHPFLLASTASNATTCWDSSGGWQLAPPRRSLFLSQSSFQSQLTMYLYELVQHKG